MKDEELMKIVYVLVSDESDLYYHQAVISFRSLRKVMPNVEVYLLVDDSTAETLKGDRTLPSELNIHLEIVNVPENMPKKLRSRFLKMSIRNVIERGDLLYIDCDTIICSKLEPFDCEIGMVLDKHLRLSQHPLREAIERNADYCGYHPAYEDKHFNGGFMWVRDCETSKEFFALWKKLYFDKIEFVTQDQASLNETNYRMGGIIKEIPAVYNCQVSSTGTFIQYLTEAKMIHYFATGVGKGIPYDLANETILVKALQRPIAEEIEGIIASPRTAFGCVRSVGTDDRLEYLRQTYSYEKLLRRYTSKSIVFIIEEKISLYREKIVSKLRKLIEINWKREP